MPSLANLYALKRAAGDYDGAKVWTACPLLSRSLLTLKASFDGPKVCTEGPLLSLLCFTALLGGVERDIGILHPALFTMGCVGLFCSIAGLFVGLFVVLTNQKRLKGLQNFIGVCVWVCVYVYMYLCMCYYPVDDTVSRCGTGGVN